MMMMGGCDGCWLWVVAVENTYRNTSVANKIKTKEEEENRAIMKKKDFGGVSCYPHHLRLVVAGSLDLLLVKFSITIVFSFVRVWYTLSKVVFVVAVVVAAHRTDHFHA